MITKEQLKEKTSKLINDAHESMLKNLDKVLENEHIIDYEKYDNDFILPRMVLQGLLKEEAFQYKPLSIDRKGKLLIEQIYSAI